MDAILAAARFVHYAAALQFFGVTTFYTMLAPRGLRAPIARPYRLISAWSAVLSLLSAIVWLMAAAGSMGEGPADAIDPDVVSLVLTQTGFGHVWGWRLVLCAAGVLAALIGGDAAWWAATLCAAVVLGSLGLVGHAAIDGGIVGLFNETSQVLHLLSSGFWVGALIPLLSVLALFRDPASEPLADQTLRRFSGLGHLAVAVLLLTGLTNTYFILGDRVDLGRPYEQLLLVKIALAGTMCLLAIVNRYVFMPRIRHGGPGARQLTHGTVGEIVLSGAILLLVSAIGIMSPN